MTGVFDLAVVGAGPGGSNAAAAALSRGLEVVQLERRRLPRSKPCGGALTVKARQALRLDLGPSLRGEHRGFTFRSRGGEQHHFRFPASFLSMVHRSEFDLDLVRQNLRKPGFRLLQGHPVREVGYDGEVFRLVTDRTTVLARQLVGADGSQSLVARRFRIARPRGKALAVEITPRSQDLPTMPPRVPLFDFGAVPDGYGWVFPKKGCTSIGLYFLRGAPEGGADPRDLLLAYAADRGLRPRGDPLETFEAGAIPIGGDRPRPTTLPVYLVGDAGGYAEALTGEGIYHALESGRLAGETAADVARGRATPGAYYRRLRRPVLADTHLSWRVAGTFYRHLDRSIGLLRRGPVWRVLLEGYGRGAPLARCLARSPFYWLGSLLDGRSRHRCARRRGALRLHAS